MLPIGVACAIGPVLARQSMSAQQAPQTEPQQSGVLPPHIDLLTHLCVLRSQLSSVQPLPSLQSEFWLH